MKCGVNTCRHQHDRFAARHDPGKAEGEKRRHRGAQEIAADYGEGEALPNRGPLPCRIHLRAQIVIGARSKLDGDRAYDRPWRTGEHIGD